MNKIEQQLINRLEELLNSTDEYPLIEIQINKEFGKRSQMAIINHQRQEYKEARILLEYPSSKKNETLIQLFIFLGGDFNWKYKNNKIF